MLVKHRIQPTNAKQTPARQWLKRIGLAGFLFFLIKGLLWLIVPAAMVYFGLTF